MAECLTNISCKNLEAAKYRFGSIPSLRHLNCASTKVWPIQQYKQLNSSFNALKVTNSDVEWGIELYKRFMIFQKIQDFVSIVKIEDMDDQALNSQVVKDLWIL